MVGGGSGRKLNRLSGAVGKLLYATMNTASVVSFRLSGSGTHTVTSPQIPTNPGGQVGVGWGPLWDAAALDAATPPGDLRDLTRQMREAVVEAKLAVEDTRAALARAERDLADERRRLADAERRGRLAAEIQDGETVEVAQRFAAKHHERVGVLEHKRAALAEERALYERELAEMQAQLVRAERDRPLTEAERSVERAWRDLQAAGGARPGTDIRDELLKSELERAAREAAAERQLKELKKKMKKDRSEER